MSIVKLKFGVDDQNVKCHHEYLDSESVLFYLRIQRPPRSTRMTHSFPTRRSSDLDFHLHFIRVDAKNDHAVYQAQGIGIEVDQAPSGRAGGDRKSTRLNSSH